MTTTRSHAAPWTIARMMRMLIAKPSPRPEPVLTGREATARHLFGEAVQWSRLDMLDYDNSPSRRAGWLAEADRRIAQPELDLSELIMARWHGYTPAQWLGLPPHVQVAKRDGYAQARGL